MEDTIVPSKTEIIAVASGKGGTGKTLVASCLAYALIRGGQRVLIIDCDPATDGMSLFLLGRKGWTQVSNFEPMNTFVGVLREFQRTGSISFKPRPIYRGGFEDHGIPYNAIISGKGLYGDDEGLATGLAVPDLDRSLFREGIQALFQALRGSSQYDYILVDTRGGFAFESTDICGLADSFIVVTEPDPTSFYQDRNLVRRINQAAHELSSPSVLRAFLVNKAVDGVQQQGTLDLAKIESSFRLELTKEFPVSYQNTHPVPVDLNALLAYKTQRIPYIADPASLFSFATLSAFSDILQVVTSRWSSLQVDKWNELVHEVSSAVARKNQEAQRQRDEELNREKELSRLRTEVEGLSQRLELVQQEKEVFERERSRMETAFARELESLKANYRVSEQKPEEKVFTSEIERKRDLGRRWLKRLLYAAPILLLCAVVGTFGWTKWREYESNDLILKAYNQSLPPTLRISSVYQLQRVYGYTQFDSINLDKLDLARWYCYECSLRGASLGRTDLSSAHLPHAKLASADMKGANLSGADLVGADLGGAVLLEANLDNSDLTSANLRLADLTSASLRGANLQGADLTDADLSFSDLRGAKTSDWRIVMEATNWREARYDKATLELLGLAPDYYQNKPKYSPKNK